VTYFVFTLVLVGAFLHAFWNTLIKLSPDKPLETACMNLATSLLALPFFIYAGFPETPSIPYLMGSLMLHVIYYYSLSNAYRLGDMSLTYPIMRGVATLILIVLLFILDVDRPSVPAVMGIVMIGAGVVLLGLTNAHQRHLFKAILFALLNASVIAGYTLTDALGVREVSNPLTYIAMFMLIDGLAYSMLLFHQRSWPTKELRSYIKIRWVYFIFGACATSVSYGIALWAMSVAPIAMVASLREVSVLFAVLIGVYFLKESVNKYRWLGVCMIFLGGVLIKLF